MHGIRTASSFTLALLAATFLTPPFPARAEPGDAQGPEFRVNSFKPDDQGLPSVAMDADGDFVVVWQSYDQEGVHLYGVPYGTYGIFARRYDAAGVAQGPDFLVNTYWLGRQVQPAVAMDADGDFVVAWRGSHYANDVDGAGIFAQRFDAAGVAQGPEFLVNNVTEGSQWTPAIAMDADGDFVVAWTWLSGEISARCFDAAGIAKGPEFKVNSFSSTVSLHSSPSVAMDADGDFVVAWQSFPQDGSSYGIFAQRFDATCAVQGPEFLVNSHTTFNQEDPTVAMDADGDFVVAWNSARQDGDYLGVFVRRFDAAGVALAPEVQVNTFTTGWQNLPAVAMDADGDFVVVWESQRQDGDGQGVFAQRFGASGVPSGPEFLVNTYTTSNQENPTVAMDADGDFVVAWTNYAGPASNRLIPDDVSAQRYQGEGSVPNDFTLDGRADILWRNTANGNTNLWQMDGFTKETMGSIGELGIEWQVQGLADFNADTKTDVLWRNTSTGSAVIWLMDGFTRLDAGGIGAPSLDWEIVGTGDFDGDDYADILWRNVTNGAALIWLVDGLKKNASGGIGGVPLVWEVAGVGDFDADARADILWRNTTTGAAVVWLMDGFTKDSSGGIGATSTDWHVEGLGTFNSDARSDILWRNSSTGNTVIWKMNGLAKEDAAAIGAPPLVWRIEGVGDTDGDRQSDIIWRNTTTSNTLVWRMDSFVKDAVGNIGAVPLVWDVQ